MSSNETLKQEILDWEKAQGRQYYDSLNLFWENLAYGDIELPSGTATYVDQESDVGDGESLAIFSVGGTNYALRGTYTSWGSEWDSGPWLVEKRTVTLERWETL